MPMMIQENTFLQGTLGAFTSPFVPPFLPQSPKWQPAESGFQDDADNLQNDWLVVGNYLSDAVNDYERNITEKR